jgi:hypothetical protein
MHINLYTHSTLLHSMDVRSHCHDPIDGRLGSRSRGYHPIAPRPLRYGPFVRRL